MNFETYKSYKVLSLKDTLNIFALLQIIAPILAVLKQITGYVLRLHPPYLTYIAQGIMRLDYGF